MMLALKVQSEFLQLFERKPGERNIADPREYVSTKMIAVITPTSRPRERR
jgi:hypothetical protein